MNNIKLVKFENGKYGVRKGWINYEYRQLGVYNNWWYAREHSEYQHCQGTREAAITIYELLMDIGEEIDYESLKST